MNNDRNAKIFKKHFVSITGQLEEKLYYVASHEYHIEFFELDI